MLQQINTNSYEAVVSHTTYRVWKTEIFSIIYIYFYSRQGEGKETTIDTEKRRKPNW
jgi:hypothetical protein